MITVAIVVLGIRYYHFCTGLAIISMTMTAILLLSYWHYTYLSHLLIRPLSYRAPRRRSPGTRPLPPASVSPSAPNAQRASSELFF